MPIRPLTTTGIGSLPHQDVDAALQQSFRMDIPYVPQLPMRDANEYMLPHALEGMPGIEADDEGMILLDLGGWKKGHVAYDAKLHAAIEDGQVELFLPSPAYAAALEPFLARVKKDEVARAKAQIAGPMTLQWSLRTADGKMPPPAVMTHVSRTILARSLALASAITQAGAEPIVFIDEPGLYAFSRMQPNHIVMLQELRINLMALKKQGAQVGLHCCSDADWGALMGLGLDILAVDAKLSLPSLMRAGEALVTFVSMGGRLALGVIPTDSGEVEPIAALIKNLESRLSTLEQYFPTRASIIEHILFKSLLTPACGLALLKPEFAESVTARLDEFRGAFRDMQSRHAR